MTKLQGLADPAQINLPVSKLPELSVKKAFQTSVV